MRLDDLDSRLVALLAADARLSFRDLAERLGVSTPTVSQRVKDLEELGVLRGYHARVDPRYLPGGRRVLVARVTPAAAAGVLDALLAIAGVEETILLGGGLVHARLRGTAVPAAHAALAALPGVVGYDVHDVLDARDGPAASEGPLDLDVPCHECKGPIHGESVRGRFGERAHVFCCRGCLGRFRERYDRAAARA